MSSTEKELALESEKEELECSLCKDTFREPKTLGCLHSFCLECLEIHYEKTHSNVGLKCPICRTPFQSQSTNQLASLPTDSYLLNALYIHNSLKNSIAECDNQKVLCSDGESDATHYCFDCQEYFCELCTRSHQKIKTTKNHQVIPIDEMKNQTQINVISKSSSQVYCQIHTQEELKIFCNDCKLTICSLCVPKHSAHKFLTISEIIENESQSLTDLINQVKPKEEELREGISKCEEVIKQLEINSTTTQTQINQLFNKIRNKLDEKEQELLNKLEEIEKYRKKELEIQKEDLKFGIENIIGSCQSIENSISLLTQNDVRFLSMRNLYHERLDYLSNNQWKIEPCHHSLIGFSINEKEEQSIYSSLSNIGMIDSSDISADKCLISRNDKQIIYENEEFKFEIITYSKDGNQIKNGGNEKRFTIHIEIEGEQKNENRKDNELEIVDLNNGKYEVKMKLKDEGKYSIFVQSDGFDLHSSPFQIQVNSMKIKAYKEISQPKLTFGSKGNGNGQFVNPYGVISNSKGNILVCDDGNDRVQIFDYQGKFILTFGSKGNGNGQFQNPDGIAINSKGNILVSDSNNNRIQMFNSEGKFISTFGSFGNGNGQFNFPWGICIDKNDNIIVCDYNNNRIQIFNSKGNFVSMFGSFGNGNGQFNRPYGIAINSKGNILVCDNQNHRIQIFDSQGKFISTFGSKGKGNGQFQNLEGICVDMNDNIFVCDYGNNRIQIFNSKGEYMAQFKVKKPTYITINPKTHNIIVCGNDNKVSIF